MQKREKIVDLIQSVQLDREVTVMGWIRSFRNDRFIALNDGSTIKTLQVVIDQENEDFALLKRFTVGAAIKATGRIIESQKKVNQGCFPCPGRPHKSNRFIRFNDKRYPVDNLFPFFIFKRYFSKLYSSLYAAGVLRTLGRMYFIIFFKKQKYSFR